jgi:Ion transport protein
VDIIFFTDIFIQIRTPYRDDSTGRLVLDIKQIAVRYITSWFFLDLISVLPFEFLGNFFHTGTALAQLGLLRFFRLTRLLVCVY